jgi:two-component sensor histidine kinase
VPNVEDYWLAAHGSVSRSGEPTQIEGYNQDTGTWYRDSISRVGAVGSRRVAVVIEDVSQAKRAEQIRREREERQAFLLQLSDALRPLADPIAVQEQGCRVLAEHVGADRTYYCDIDEVRHLLVVGRDYVRGDAPSLVGAHPIAMFDSVIDEMRAGRSVAADDVEDCALIAAADRSAYLQLSIRSFICVPLIKDGALVAAMCISNMLPRKWRSQDVHLLQDVGERVWDAVERARVEAHRELLIGELNHRVKNTLATVQSFAMQTLGTAAEADAFTARLHGLAATHDLLTRSEWQSVTLRELLQAELEPYGRDRFEVRGDDPALASRTALALNMAVHELATNAAKYGALSRARGKINIAGTLAGENARRLTIEWRETGGPEVTPPAQRGFGTRLIQDGLVYELDADVDIDYAPSGLACTIELTLAATDT